MPPRLWRFRIRDVIDAITKIQRYTEGMTRESFIADERTIDAVARNITIIGEAARHIPVEIESRYSGVPWADMRDMRNIVVHEYFRVSLDVVWDTTQDDLPPLVPLFQEILEREQ